MCWSAPSVVMRSTTPRTYNGGHGFAGSWLAIITRGSRRTFRAFCRPSAVLNRTRSRSTSTSTHSGITCGDPSSFVVARYARFVPWSNRIASSVNTAMSSKLLLRLLQHPEPQFAELRLIDRCRRSGQRIGARLRFGERRHIADRILAGHEHHHAIDPHGDPTMRRSAESERGQHVTELLLRLLVGHAEHVEYLRLHVGAMDADAAASDLEPVEHQIIGSCLRGGGLEIGVVFR